MYNATYLSISMISALLVFMIDYGFGFPGDANPNHQSLLFRYSYLLAKRRLKITGKWNGFYSQLINQLSNAESIFEKEQIRNSFKQLVFTQARQLFTFEKALGMCPICTHFWINNIIFFLVNKFYQKENIIIFGLYYLLSHLFIRLLKKI